VIQGGAEDSKGLSDSYTVSSYERKCEECVKNVGENGCVYGGHGGARTPPASKRPELR
jgi:hypothetical protein